MSKKLVAYFSATGTTKRLAESLAAAIGADLYEIQPAQPYTPDDLDWHSKSSRSSIETEDKSSRPAVAGRVENMGQYDTVFVGFPIWWYVAPTVINTFLEQYDLFGKTVIPFATSGSSNMGKTNDYLKPSCKGAILKDGKRFASNAKESELKLWADDFT
ncbi:MAG: NAD(P)H-dependent oxidoreductase [Clostridiales bacterium]|nr:NAD(P)H-dependent oxidoreductase [Clostridiales bacterium]